jgi:hypothetical protein
MTTKTIVRKYLDSLNRGDTFRTDNGGFEGKTWIVRSINEHVTCKIVSVSDVDDTKYPADVFYMPGAQIVRTVTE